MILPELLQSFPQVLDGAIEIVGGDQRNHDAQKQNTDEDDEHIGADVLAGGA